MTEIISLNSLRKKLVFSLIAYVSVAFLIVAFVAVYPLYRHYHDNNRQQFLDLVDEHAHFLHEHITNLLSIADQTSHKTGVRSKQQALREGKITRKAFEDYVVPRLSTIMEYNPEIVAITKTNAAYESIVQVGIPFLLSVEQSEEDNDEVPHLHAPVAMKEGVFFRIHIPLFDDDSVLMGHDFYLASTREISEILGNKTISYGDVPFWLAFRGEAGGTPYFLPSVKANDSSLCCAIKDSLSFKDGENKGFFDCSEEGDGDCLTAYSEIQGTNVVLIAQIDGRILYADIRENMSPVLFSVICLTLAGGWGLLLFFYPIADRVFLRASDLAELNWKLRLENDEREKAEAQARYYATLYRTIFENAPVGIAMTDESGKPLLANEKFRRFLGYEEHELSDLNIQDLPFPDDNEVGKAMSSGTLDVEIFELKGEREYVRKDGSIVWGERVIATFSDPLSGKMRFLLIVEDITRRKQIEEENRGIQRRLSDIIDFLPNPTVVFDREGEIVRWNKEMENLTGASRVEMLGKTSLDAALFFYGKARPLLSDLVRKKTDSTLCNYDNFVSRGETLMAEKYLPAPYGGRGGYFRMKAAPFYDDAGDFEGTIESLVDFTEEWRMRKDEEILRQRLEALWGVARLTDLDLSSLCNTLMSETIAMTSSCYGFFGFIDDDETTMNLHSWSNEVLADCRVEKRIRIFPLSEGKIWSGAVRSGEPVILNDCEDDFYNDKTLPEGHVHIRRIMVVPSRQGNKTVAITAVANKETDYTADDAVQVGAFVGALYSIIEKRKAEDALLLSERRNRQVAEELAAILDAYPDYIARMDSSMTILWGNHKAARYLGERCYETWGFDSPCNGCPIPDTLRTGERREGRIKHPDGKIYDIRTYPLQGNSSGERHAIVFTSDVTMRVRDEKAEERSARLSALGELVAGVAHEINNPNGLILLNATVLNDILAAAPPVFEEYFDRHGDFSLGRKTYAALRNEIPRMAEDILEATRRIKGIVGDLKEFSTRSRKEMSDIVNLNDVVKTSLRLSLKTVEKFTSAFQVIYGADLPPILGNFQRLEQVVINLVINACQSLPAKEKGVFVSTSFDEDRSALVLEVRDEGEGIAAANLSRVTDPFFTTRREVGGTGLGLSISGRIVKEHGGHLQIESIPGEGTTIRVFLPLAPTDTAVAHSS